MTIKCLSASVSVSSCMYVGGVCVCSIAESDSLDAESAADESDMNEVGMTVTRFVTRFIDKVCTESSVRADHVKALHQMIPGQSPLSTSIVMLLLLLLSVFKSRLSSFSGNIMS